MRHMQWISGVVGVCLACAIGAFVTLWIVTPDADKATASTIADSRSESRTASKSSFVDSDIHWIASPADATIPNDAIALTYTLERLQSTALIAFESAPNFSYMRMPPVVRESTPPRHAPLLVHKLNTFVEQDRQPKPGEPKPTEAWLWLNEMTGLCTDGFVYRPKEVRWPFKGPDDRPKPPQGLVCGYPHPDQRTFDEYADNLTPFPGQRDLWRVSTIELIGLWQRESPLVFEHRNNGMTDDSIVRVQTRHVTRRETTAISMLEENAQIVATFDGEESVIRLVGAIRAGKDCLECHHTEEGTLLGAFSYRIEPFFLQEIKADDE